MKNQVSFIGQVSSDLHVKTLETGSQVARFNLEVNKDLNHPKHNKNSDRFRMFAWGETAKFISQNLVSGAKVLVNGRLVNRTYIDAKGIIQKISEVEVRSIVKIAS